MRNIVNLKWLRGSRGLRGLRSFRKEEAGAATVEAVLWLPAFVVIFVLVADVSFVFHRQSQILRVVQDGNRALSVGRLSSEEELQDFIKTRLSTLSSSVTVATEISTGTVKTEVLVPVNHLVAVGMFNFLADYNVGVTSQQFIEY